MKKDNKTIGITVRFFTNGLPDKVGDKGNITPFWTCGSVYIEANKTKGIVSAAEMFNFIDDIPRAITKVIAKSRLAAVEDVSYALKFKNRR